MSRISTRPWTLWNGRLSAQEQAPAAPLVATPPTASLCMVAGCDQPWSVEHRGGWRTCERCWQAAHSDAIVG